MRLKAKVGRERKHDSWVEQLHIELREDFDRLCKLAVKFNTHILQLFTLNILDTRSNGVNLKKPHRLAYYTEARKYYHCALVKNVLQTFSNQKPYKMWKAKAPSRGRGGGGGGE